MGECPTAPRDRGACGRARKQPRTKARGRRLATSSASAQLKGARAPGTWSHGGEGPALAFASALSLDGDGNGERSLPVTVAPAPPATTRARPAATTTTRSPRRPSPRARARRRPRQRRGGQRPLRPRPGLRHHHRRRRRRAIAPDDRRPSTARDHASTFGGNDDDEEPLAARARARAHNDDLASVEGGNVPFDHDRVRGTITSTPKDGVMPTATAGRTSCLRAARVDIPLPHAVRGGGGREPPAAPDGAWQAQALPAREPRRCRRRRTRLSPPRASTRLCTGGH